MSAREAVVAGETVLLLAEKALYWPARKMLVVADIHFGKAASFRAQGVPVPRGTWDPLESTCRHASLSIL